MKRFIITIKKCKIRPVPFDAVDIIDGLNQWFGKYVEFTVKPYKEKPSCKYWKTDGIQPAWCWKKEKKFVICNDCKHYTPDQYGDYSCDANVDYGCPKGVRR